MFSWKYFSATFILAVISVNAETHTVHFTNNCGQGTPTLLQNGNVLSTGSDFTVDGLLNNAVAFLQTGSCGSAGEGCTLVELSLANPTGPGTGSFADLSLISPHAFSVPTGFNFFNGCEGRSASCTTADCSSAFHGPTDSQKEVACDTNNRDVNLEISFCA
ncbi:hypothetical protein CVT24_002476 [Panaeolus cyanescens]|uniref:Glycopeptide n=1 Tax=Panaeolus cyanescens TaxID=181874 RepID=A0A409YTP3_9AGAR|nr:hypothetical protein CVT24_002476 [Panaeolus cyanescens]